MIRRLAVTCALFWATVAAADDLPVNLQVQLLSKMSTYVSNFAPKGASSVKVYVVHPGTKDAPSRGAQALNGALGTTGKLGAYTAEVVLVPWENGKKLEAAIAADKPQVVYLAPELDAKATGELVEAVSSSSALMISGVADHVKQGAVLGFSLVEARPRVLINLKQARRQNIVFLSGLVSHSVVVDN